MIVYRTVRSSRGSQHSQLHLDSIVVKTTPLVAVPSPPIARWELAVLAAAALCALALGSANLGAASIWHDEAVHVLVARSMAESWWPRLPSGELYHNGNVYNGILALFIACFGDSEAVVRSPAVLFSVLNVLLTYGLTRRLVGRGTALTAAFALALSPWSVAWAREARFYSLQQSFYLLFLWTAWEFMTARKTWGTVAAGAGALFCYVAGFFVSWHSLLYAAPVVAFAVIEMALRRELVSRSTLALVALAALAALALGYFSALNFVDRSTVLVGSRLGQGLPSAGVKDIRAAPFFYVDWLCRNLSTGYLLLALLGTAILCARKTREGFFAVLCFWAPILVLSVFIGYRRQRFMFFAYPFYGVLFSCALVRLGGVLAKPRPSWLWRVSAIAILLFGLRLSISTAQLFVDSIALAKGADASVERRHPQWREPCWYVKSQLDDGVVVLTTTFCPVYYYVGRVDEWFPSRALPGEARESGMAGLPGLPELIDYVDRHPRGYFLAELRRFEFNEEFLAADVAWVKEHMTRVQEACSSDVTVYKWGF